MRRVLCIVVRLFSLSAVMVQTVVASSQTAGQPKPVKPKDIENIYVSSAVPVPTYGAKVLKVHFVNRFRYDVNPLVVSTPIAAASLPSVLGPSAGNAKTTAEIAARTTGVLLPCSPSDTVKTCWDSIQADVVEQSAELFNLRTKINQAIRAASAEQACYQLRLKLFNQILLTKADAQALLDFANENGKEQTSTSSSCYHANLTDWDFAKIDEVDQRLFLDRAALDSLTLKPEFTQWLVEPNKALNTALIAQIDTLTKEVRSYGRGESGQGADATIAKTYEQFQTVVQGNLLWRARLKKIADANPNDLEKNEQMSLEIELNDCNEWYGRGRTDAVTMRAVDVSSGTTITPDLAVATNTCTPLSIVSTGFGVTFLPIPTYGFVPDPSGVETIRKTAVNDRSILYALLYNVHLASLGKNSGVELLASPGAGLTSASSTTTADWLAGLSLSFARRLIFLTGSADFGSRTELAAGFAEGTPKGSLSSVPTRTNMQIGAMLSITFGIAPSSK